MNWALAKEGVTPTGAAHRNVPKSSLPAAKAAGKDGALLLTGASGSELPAGWAMGFEPAEPGQRSEPPIP